MWHCTAGRRKGSDGLIGRKPTALRCCGPGRWPLIVRAAERVGPDFLLSFFVIAISQSAVESAAHFYLQSRSPADRISLRQDWSELRVFHGMILDYLLPRLRYGAF